MISFLLNSGRRKGKKKKKKVLNSFWSPVFNCFSLCGLPEVVLIFTLRNILVCLEVGLSTRAGWVYSVSGEHVHDASCLASCWRGCRFVLGLSVSRGCSLFICTLLLAWYVPVLRCCLDTSEEKGRWLLPWVEESSDELSWACGWVGRNSSKWLQILQAEFFQA